MRLERFSYLVATAVTVMSGLLLVSPARAATSCAPIPSNVTGFYGTYYNLRENDPGMGLGSSVSADAAKATTWFQPVDAVYGRVDASLNFGTKFFPVKGTLPGDPFYFSAHWRAEMTAPTTGEYSITLRNDDNAWVYIDNVLVLSQGDDVPVDTQSTTARFDIGAGVHTIDVYYVERSPVGAVFALTLDRKITNIRPRNSGCVGTGTIGSGTATGTTGSGSATGAGRGRVAGAETATYTPAIGLYRVAGTPDIYAIYANGRRHHISGPAAFENYGYDYTKVKTVSLAEFNRYRDVQLVRTPESATVYYLSARGAHQWLKVPLLTPTVFASYEQNYWGDVVTIDELDLRTYQNVELVRQRGQTTIYLFKDGVRQRFVSEQVARDLGYNPHEALEITETHLESFTEGEPIG